MIIVDDLGLRFKGERQYIHGTDIIGAILDITSTKFNSYPDELSGSFHGLLQKQGSARVYSEDYVVEPIDYQAQFKFVIKGKRYRIEIFATDMNVVLSYPYYESDVLCGSSINGKTISMAHKEKYTYIEQIVALTKKLHHEVYLNVKDKWLFSKIKLNSHTAPNDYQEKKIAIKALKNMGNKLSQCAIMVDDFSIGQIYFTAMKQGAEK